MVGRQIAHYQFLERLGAGGMGEIYKAQDSRLHRFVAIKVLAAGKAGNADLRRRFVQEAQAASALNHPNIITIHDILAEADTDFMVLEFVPGKTLVQVLASGALPVTQVVNYGVQVADALSAAHEAGIIHRDLKPANVMVTDAGRIKVLDFGLAKVSLYGAESEQRNDAMTVTQGPMTVEGSVLGTINYMSPEQAEGKRVDARADIFSFGLLMYEMVTGRRGFDSDSNLSTLTAILRDEVRPIPEFVPNVPPKLEQLISGCLRKKPEDRWQSMRDVHAALAAMKAEADSAIFLGTQPALAQRLAAKPPTSGKPAAAGAKPAGAKAAQAKSSTGVLVAVIAAVMMMLLAVVGAGAWWVLSRRTVQPEPAPAETAVIPPAPADPVTPAPVEPAPVTTPAPPPAKGRGGVAPKAGAPKTGAPPAAASTKPAATEPEKPAAVKPAPIPAPPAAPVVPLRTVALADALPISISLNDDIPLDAPAGMPLRFTVAQDFRAGDAVAIAKGSAVFGEIVEAGKRRLIGGSKITFRLTRAQAADGRTVNVRATPGKRDERNARPVETPVKPKSKEVAASAGAQYIAYIDGAQTVSVPGVN